MNAPNTNAKQLETARAWLSDTVPDLVGRLQIEVTGLPPEGYPGAGGSAGIVIDHDGVAHHIEDDSFIVRTPSMGAEG